MASRVATWVIKQVRAARAAGLRLFGGLPLGQKLPKPRGLAWMSAWVSVPAWTKAMARLVARGMASVTTWNRAAASRRRDVSWVPTPAGAASAGLSPSPRTWPVSPARLRPGSNARGRGFSRVLALATGLASFAAAAGQAAAQLNLVTPMPDQTAVVGVRKDFMVPEGTFSKANAELVFSFTATPDAASWLYLQRATAVFPRETYVGGMFRARPLPGAVGNVTVTVTAVDGDGESASDTFTLTVSHPPNAAPTAGADSLTVRTGDGGTSLHLISNPSGLDSDANDDALTVVHYDTGTNLGATPAALPASVPGSYGSLSVAASGAATYTPNNPSTGTGMDVFTYRIDDGSGAANSTATATVTVTVEAAASANRAPRQLRVIPEFVVRRSDTGSLAINEAGAEYFVDDDGDGLTYELHSCLLVPNLRCVPRAADNYVTLKEGTDGVWRLAYDGTAARDNSFRAVIMVSDGTETIGTPTFFVRIASSLAATDAEPVVRNPFAGDRYVRQADTFITVPIQEFTGDSIFAYDDSTEQVYTIDSGELRYAATSTGGAPLPEWLTFLPTGTENNLNYYMQAPSGSFSSRVGSYPITVTAYNHGDDGVAGNSDDRSAQYEFTLVVEGQANTAPTLGEASDPSYEKEVTEAGGTANGTPGDAAAQGAFTYEDSDDDDMGFGNGGVIEGRAGSTGDFMPAATASVALEGSYGDLTLDADGTWSYRLVDSRAQTDMLKADAEAADAFDFRIDDGESQNRYSNTVTVTIMVTGANDAPRVNQAIDDRTAPAGVPFSMVIPAATFMDVDADDVVTVTVDHPTWMSYDSGTRTLSGQPANAHVVAGGDEVTVTGRDLLGAEVSESFRVTLERTDNPPREDDGIADLTGAERIRISSTQAWSHTFAATAFTDPDEDPLTYEVTLQDGTNRPAWLLFDSATRTLSAAAGTIPASAYSTAGLALRVTAQDPDMNSAAIDFLAPFQPPALAFATPASAASGSDITLNIAIAGGSEVPAAVSAVGLDISSGSPDLFLDPADVTQVLSGTSFSLPVSAGSQGSPDLMATLSRNNAVINRNETVVLNFAAPAAGAGYDLHLTGGQAQLDLTDLLPAFAVAEVASTDPATMVNFQVTRIGTNTAAVTVVAAISDPDGALDLGGVTTQSLSFAATDTMQPLALTRNASGTTGTVTVTLTATAEYNVGAAGAVTNAGTATASATLAAVVAENVAPTLGEDDDPSYEKEVTEAGGTDNGTMGDPAAQGAFTYEDPDSDDTGFGNGGVIEGRAGSAGSFMPAATASVTLMGTYGDLTLDADGTWSYRLVDSRDQTDMLKAGAGVTDAFDFRIDDGESENRYSNTVTVTIAVTGANDAPRINQQVDDQNAQVGSRFELVIPADAFRDVDADDEVTLQVTGLPWLDYDPATRTLEGQPTRAHVVAGGQPVSIVARDRASAEVVMTFRVTVAAVNSGPTVAAAIDDMAVAVGTMWEFMVPAGTFMDDDGDTLTITAPNPPGWVTFDAATATFRGTPQATDVGGHTVTVRADDGNEGMIDDVFTITVGAAPTTTRDELTVTEDDGAVAVAVANGLLVNDTPVDASRPLTVSAFAAGQVLGDSPTEAGETLEHEDFGTLTVNADGSFSYTPRAGAQALAVNDDERHVFTYQVSDSQDVSSTGVLEVIVTGVNDAPMEAAGIRHQSATEGSEWLFVIPANAFSDVDGDALGFTVANADGSAVPWLAVETLTGTATQALRGIPPAGSGGTLPTLRLTADDSNGGTETTDFVLFIDPPLGMAPTLSGEIMAQTIAARLDFSLDLGFLTVSDPEGDDTSLRVRAAGGGALPSWLRFNSASSTLSGRPGLADRRGYDLEVIAVDERRNISVPLPFSLTVIDTALTFAAEYVAARDAIQVNLRHVVGSGNPAAVNYELAVDSPTVNVSLAGGGAAAASSVVVPGQIPSGSMDLAFFTTQLAFDRMATPGEEGGNTVTITLRAPAAESDGEVAFVIIGAATQTVDVPRRVASQEPMVANRIPNQAATVTRPWSYAFPEATFSEPDGEALSYGARNTFGDTLPLWLGFNVETRTFSGTPPSTAVGSTLSITVTATDPHGYGAEDDFLLVLEPVAGNRPPVIVMANSDQDIMEDAPFMLDVSGTFMDPDSGDTLTLRASQADGTALPMWLSFDPVMNILSGTPNQAAVGGDGITVHVIANDGRGGEIFDPFVIMVTNVNDAPVASDPIANQQVVVGNRYVLDVTGAFSDEDDDPLSFTVALGPAGGPAAILPRWLSFDPVTNMLSGRAAFSDVTATPLEVTVTADDNNGGEGTDSFLLRVAAIDNRPPTVANAPADQDVNVGRSFEFTLADNVFTDPDGDALTYEVTTEPAELAWLTVDTTTLTFSGLAPATAADTAVTVTVTADDGYGGRTPTSFRFNWRTANQPPMVAAGIADQTVIAGEAFRFTVGTAAFADADGDALTLTAALTGATTPAAGMLPAWLAFDGAAGAFSGTPPDAADRSAIRLTVTASDGFGGTAMTDFVIRVGLNTPPAVVSPIPAQSVRAGVPWTFTFPDSVFRDAEGDDVTYAATTVPDASGWLAFNAATRTFSGTPPAASSGTIVTVTVTAADVFGDATPTTFQLLIGEPNHAPGAQFQALAFTAYAGIPFSLSVPDNAFQDGNLDALSYEAALENGGEFPDWLSFDEAAGIFSGIPAAGDITTAAWNIDVTADDGFGAGAPVRFQLSVASTSRLFGTVTGAAGGLVLNLPYVEVRVDPAVDGGGCVTMTLAESAGEGVSDMARWQVSDIRAVDCDLPPQAPGVPHIDDTLAINVPAAHLNVPGVTGTCLGFSFQFTAIENVALLGVESFQCPAP